MLNFWKHLWWNWGKNRARKRQKQTNVVTDQLEMCNADWTLVVHLLLVLILNQTLHQITCVDLVISKILQTNTHIIIIYKSRRAKLITGLALNSWRTEGLFGWEAKQASPFSLDFMYDTTTWTTDRYIIYLPFK